jgi:glycosyltransferase involved in cell wall biosynthesis
MDLPDVTVIVPVLDNEGGLRECLQGLQAQTYPRDSVTIVVADNGSSPPLDAGRLGLPGVAIVRCERPGSYAARNEGAREARGPVLAFTDADCIPDADWIARGVAALGAGDANSIVGGEVLFQETRSRSGTSLYQLASGFGQQRNIECRGFSATANLFCTEQQFRNIGPFDETLFSAGDREWCWRAQSRGIGVRFEPRCVVRTLPRVRLRDAIRQARRVAAGRAQLGARESSNSEGLRRERNLSESISWVWSIQSLSVRDRVRVLAAAAAIRIAAAAEGIRLRLGGPAERR